MPPKTEKSNSIQPPAQEGPTPLAAFPDERNALEKEKDKLAKCCKGVRWTVKFILKVLFGVVTLAAVLVAIAVVAVATMNAAYLKEYQHGSSAKTVSLTILALAAGGTIIVIIASCVLVCRKKAPKRNFWALLVLLLVLAVIQVVIVSLVANPTQSEESAITRTLVEKFREAMSGNQQQIKDMDSTQHLLSCCGVFTPDDYKSPNQLPFIPPEIPITCCDTYDPQRPTQAQEREREVCRARKMYYLRGCNDPLHTMFREGAHLLVGLVVILVLLQLIGVGVISERLIKKWRKDQDENA